MNPSTQCYKYLFYSYGHPLNQALGQTIGSQQQRHNFWTTELQHLVELRELCYQKWRRAARLNEVIWWTRHHEASAYVRRALKKRNRETWHLFCKRLETNDSITPYTACSCEF